MKKTKIITIIFCLLLASGFGVYFLVDALRENDEPIDTNKEVSTSTQEETTEDPHREEMLSKWREEYSAEYPDEIIQEWVDSWINYRRGLEDEDFYEIKKDLDIVVKAVEKFASKHPDEEQLVFLYGGPMSSPPAQAYLAWLGEGGGRLDLSKKELESLVNVAQKFTKCDVFFDGMRMYENLIAFEIIDGVYELLYSLDGNPPPKVNPVNGTKYDVVKIETEENWYHMFMDPD